MLDRWCVYIFFVVRKKEKKNILYITHHHETKKQKKTQKNKPLTPITLAILVLSLLSSTALCFSLLLTLSTCPSVIPLSIANFASFDESFEEDVL